MPNEFEFWMYRYEGTPAGAVEIFFESQLPDWETRLGEVLDFLAVSFASMAWTNTAYLKTP